MTLSQLFLGIIAVGGLCAPSLFTDAPEEQRVAFSVSQPGAQLIRRRVTVARGSTIQDLLLHNGIEPDVEALTLVYELNPQARKLSALTSGDTLLIPAAEGPLNTRPATIIVDGDLKESLSHRVEHLKASYAQAQTSIAGGSGTIVRELEETIQTLDFIRLSILRRNGRPISRETLSQLDREALLLDTTLERVSANHVYDATVVKAIKAVVMDVNIKAGAYTQIAAGKTPDRWPECRVIVRTAKRDGPVQNLRIYYVPEALRNDPGSYRPFDRLSTPTESMLPEADYIIWGAQDPEPTPVTNQHRLEARVTKGDIIVDLTLTK
jgi:hypothetical protein